MRAVHLEGHRRHERAGFTGTLGAAPAGEGFLEELADLAISVRELAGGGVAVVGGDDQTPSGRQAFDEGPEVVAAQLIGCVAGQCVEALPRTSTVVQLAIGPLVPEHPVRRTVDQTLAVLPGHVDALGGGRLELVRQAATVVLQLAAAPEAQGPRELIGFAGQFGSVGCDLV